MFQQVLAEEADTLKWDSERDGFDTAVVWVHRDSVPTFMTELKIRLGQQARAGDAGDAAARQLQETQTQTQPDVAAGKGVGGAGGGRRRGGGSPAAAKRRGMGEEEIGDADAEVDQ